MEQMRPVTNCHDNQVEQKDNNVYIENSDVHCEDIFGEHESQLSVGGEGELALHLADCKKNPGHTSFIAAETFSLEHLPEGYRDQDLYELVKAIAELTVRVDVATTSSDRPEFWPDSKVLYPAFGQSQGLRFGCGKMRSVIKYVSGYNKYEGKHKKNLLACTCHKCQQSGAPSTTWWDIELITATSVVFDDLEAQGTTCRLFYDRPDSPVVAFNKVSMDNVNIVEDRCLLICTTCDIELMDRMEKMVERFDALLWKVHDKYKASRDADKLTFITSHPHGGPKQISIGCWKHINQVGVFKFKNRFTYTASTCPGCSGAPVYILGYSWWGRWWSQHVHSGTLSSGLGCSGVGDVL